jgi:hypothetical protein
MGASRLKTEPRRACRPVFADSHDFDEEQDSDPNTHKNEKLDPDPHVYFFSTRSKEIN